MKVEVVGLPGSGKTAAARLAAELIGVPFRNLDRRREHEAGRLPRARMAYDRTGSMVRFPRIIAAGCGVARSTARREFLGAALTAARRSRALVTTASGILDEGPRHGLCAFVARNEQLEHGGLDLVDLLGRRLPRPDAILWVECDPEIAWARYQARCPDQPHSARDEQAVTDHFDRYQRAASRLIAGRLIKVDSSQASPEEVAEEIADAIRSG